MTIKDKLMVENVVKGVNEANGADMVKGADVALGAKEVSGVNVALGVKEVSGANVASGVYDSSKFVSFGDIEISEETKELLDQAGKVYLENHPKKRTWYGRCIFISWYCSVGDCTFCFRSTQKHKIKFPKNSKRSMGSVLLEALFSRLFNWRIEFITGGYGIMTKEVLLEYIKTISEVYGEKVWLNLGVLSPAFQEQIRPYVKGVCSSLETLHPVIHKEVCPSPGKAIEPYDKMFETMQGFKKSIAVIVGLGDKIEDIKYLFDFVEKHDLDRVTIYALKPIRGGAFTEAPSVEEYVTWISKLRIRFPKLEIIAGTNLRRCEEVGYLMQAGANAVTKFPATKQFATKKAFLITDLINLQGRDFISNLVKIPEGLDFEAEIDKLSIKQEYKDEMKEKFPAYLKTFLNPKDKDPALKDQTEQKVRLVVK